ncbi:hypothetical protein SY83_18265 [Paenibacillus swuensis]|uniref:GerMN domain-containing protein n=1 Tax=Paenibacillus swuensis TaxID=1178515 RepID=A0A172TLQ2_9BACL|nr:GerMN domain-containing protein [Paenibacillus swuensis]ANE47912.1 hypothetical protein SY83_18265 [Paenibacillus swuensis]
MNKRNLGIALSLSTLLLTACGDKPANENSASADSNNKAVSGSQTTSPNAKNTELTIKSYYTDDEILELVERDSNITFKSEKDKYLAALNTLKQSDQSADFALWRDVEFSITKFENGQLTIDLRMGEDFAGLGAPGEQLAIQSLQKTLFQFNEVTSISLLKEGKAVETLLGHVDLQQPIMRK